MQNTKTEYSSSERTPVVLPEMEQLLPPLSGEQFSALEGDILENGCYAPIIVNEDMVIVDGHNRFRICEKHGLPLKMLVFSFEDLLEAKQWALDTQKGRRNLDKWGAGQDRSEAETGDRGQGKGQYVCWWAGVSALRGSKGRFDNIVKPSCRQYPERTG